MLCRVSPFPRFCLLCTCSERPKLKEKKTTKNSFLGRGISGKGESDQCRLGLPIACANLGHEIVNSRLVIRRQGGWPPALGRGREGRGAAPNPARPPHPPDGKLRAIGHMSKAMTWGEARGGLSCAYIRGRQGPGTRGGGRRFRKLQRGPGTLKLAEPEGPRERSVAGAKVVEVYRAGW